MPLLHCYGCHHEWEGTKKSKCDWCGEDSYVLEEVTPFELFVESITQEPEKWQAELIWDVEETERESKKGGLDGLCRPVNS